MDNVFVMNDVYSQITNVLISKGKLDHDMTFNTIKEYLAYNMNGFTRFAWGVKKDDRANVCFFTFDSKVEHPYVLNLNLNNDEISYLIEKPINILKAIENKERVIAFTFNPETGCFTKEVIDGMYSYIEHYYIGKKVETKVYLTHELEEAIKSIKFEGLMSNRTDFISYPIFVGKKEPLIGYEMEVLNPLREQKEYLLSVNKPNRVDREMVYSKDSTLYSAYFDEMIEKGCFTSEQSKRSK